MTFEFGLLHIFAHITYTKICILHWENFKCEMVLQWMGSWQPFQVEGENVGKPLTHSSKISLNVLMMQRETAILTPY